MQWVFGIGYNDDIDEAKQIIKDVVNADECILERETLYIYVYSL
ncbi:MAG: hypothetical protein H7098_12935 [Oligoflexus sp.]|nr:hypothetical protein [Pseudopedobacter sp.]